MGIEERRERRERRIMSSSPDERHKRRKATVREFQCTHEGCGRTYSRAEHLQRHQLNRASVPWES